MQLHTFEGKIPAMSMSDIQAPKVLLGVTGGIAAYKSAEIIRRLQDQGAEVRVVMTASAEKFIGKVTLQALSGFPVHKDMFSSNDRMMEHIDLARWADKILIAPASADFIAKITHGFADDLLSTLCLAALCPISIAPAMNHAMWSNAATQANIQTLRNRNFQILGPATGDQACGETGFGRLLDVEQLVSELLSESNSLKDINILITAGPTRESIDPVRFISNHSSGKMGYALATKAQQAGANVVLISGPSDLPCPTGVQREMVESAQQMFDAVMTHTQQADIFIAAAAVADYRLVDIASQKIKKNENNLNIELQKNPDILKSVAELSNPPFCVGFAAETENLEANAKQKLKNKKLQLIIANHVGSDESGDYQGFHADSNKVQVFTENQSYDFPEESKNILAGQLLNLIKEIYEKKHPS